jgi:hypothetical protein
MSTEQWLGHAPHRIWLDEIQSMYITVPTAARGMLDPVRCQCGKIYDTAHVTVTARHADCSVWKAPCCGVRADDRSWVNQPYTRVGVHR